MIVVTGGAGFIGSNLVRALNQRGESEILIVDDLTDSSKIRNLDSCRFADYMDKDEFLGQLEDRRLSKPDLIIHQGACSNTMESDGRYMMSLNYSYSKSLLGYCQEQGLRMIYASSASVYGDGRTFRETPEHEKALNVYAFSKLQFDNYVRRNMDRFESQVVGLRYFNVYGPGESHKMGMASVAWHFHNQYLEDGEMRLFVGSDGYEDGGQERDFVWVGDVADVNLHFLDNPRNSGIFNVGSGESRSFNDVALAVIRSVDGKSVSLTEARDSGKIRYIPFPERLKGKYQSYTRADIDALRKTGFDKPLMDIEGGVKAYVETLNGGHGV